ncbi:MAG: DUF2339 domain-containing protein [Pseudomonadaceae bacterium]|nr:DUF2339 domain-containing protein [Pseudomonadaceae bacterium]
MQWIFMLAGLIVGAASDESLSGAIFGGLIGLALGQALKVRALEFEQSALRKELQAFAERFEQGTAAIHQRLLGVEAGAPAPPSVTPVTPEPAEAVALTNSAAQVDADDGLVWQLPESQASEAAADSELVWELPVLEPLPASRELPAQVWAPQPPRPAAPPSPRKPREPSLIERAIAQAKAWLFGGNTVLRVGVVLLFLGLAFLLRYATEGMVVPVQVRYAGVAATAVALLGLGWWLRLRNTNYGLMLQGTGIAVLYLTVFAAMRLHPLLSSTEALSLLVVITVCSAILAITQDALGLAAAAALGGFAAPILTSTGAGNHVALFSYFILLNSGILAIAWFKAWRVLNLIGFVGTFGIGFAWGLRSYTPELLWSTEPFLVLFFLMYVGIGLLFARRKLREALAAPVERAELLRWSARQGDYVDGSVLFGPPLIGFGLQYAVIQHLEFAAAFSALALGLFYMGLARLLAGRTGERALLLVETCIALGVVFGTLAIPLGLSAGWTSAVWAVEGSAIYWLGLHQRRPLARIFALLLQTAAVLAFVTELSHGQDSLLAGPPLGALMLGSLLFSYWQLRQAPADATAAWERRLLPVLACTGLGFLYLIAPLCFGAEATAIIWSLAGLVTLFAGLRLQERSFLFTAFSVQLLGGVVFLAQLEGSTGAGAGVFSAGWRGLMTASLIGLALIGGMLLAARDQLVRSDVRLLRSLSVVLLVGLVFINLAVLFVLPWQTASAVWAGSGLLIIWLSLHLQQRASFVFGLLLQVIGGAAFLLAGPVLLGPLASEGLKPLAHGGFWTPLVLGLAALVGAWRLHQVVRREAAGDLGRLSLERLSQLLLVWGVGWWALAWVSEVLRFASAELQTTLLLLTLAVSVALAALCALRSDWRALARVSSLLIPVAGLLLALAWRSDWHPAANFAWLAWTLLFAVHLGLLRKLPNLLPRRAVSAAHVLGCWLLLGLLALELRYLLAQLAEHYNAWRWLGWALLPSGYLWLMAQPQTRLSRLPWPFTAYLREYRVLAAAPLAALMLGWFGLANIASDGAAEPLPYLPLINPLELGLLFALFGTCQWLRSGLPQLGWTAQRADWWAQCIAGVALFSLFTAAVFRAAHHWGSVPYELSALLDSMLVQAGLSIVWTLIALPLMIVGHRHVRRELWLIGAALIAVVVAKLLFIELGNQGGLARIVSFIGVGVLLLIVGYFAPLPPRRAEPELEQVKS